MASKSVTRAITGNNGSYSRILGNFRGVDLSSDPSQVAPDRMAYSVNMWRDYESENGGAIETIPGFRKIFSLGRVSEADDGKKTVFGRIHGIFAFGNYLVVHSGTSIYRIPKSDIEKTDITKNKSNYQLVGEMNDADSSAFEYNGKLYILDGKAYRYVLPKAIVPSTATEKEKKKLITYHNTVHNVADGDAYIPTSYYNYQPYEQRNMLQKNFINKKTFLRENPVSNRTITLDKYFEFDYDDDKKTATIKKPIHNRGKVYIPRSFTKKETDGEEQTRYNVSLYGLDSETGSFAYSDIEQVVIDVGVGTIPAYSFANCKKLKRVVVIGNYAAGNLPEGTIQEIDIELDAFYGCSNLKEIWAASGVVPTNNPYSAYTKWLHYCSEIETGDEVNLSQIFTDGMGQPGWYSEPEIIPIDGETGLEKIAIEEVKWKVIATKPYAFSLIKCNDGTDDKYIAVNTYDAKLNENNVWEYLNTNYEGELWWYNFTIMDPCTDVTGVKVNRELVQFERNYETFGEGENEKRYVTSVDVLLPRSYTEEDVEIYGKGELNNFATIKDMADIYQSTTLSKDTDTVAAIGGCTVSCAFDGRVFFTGNPKLPNTVFYTHRDLTGANNPTYIGVYNYINDGVGSIPNVAMIAASSMLMVFKEDTTLEGSVFYHTGQDNTDTTAQDLIPRIYPSVQGVAGIGCLGAACNFADDAVFISKKGLEAIGKEQVNLERTIQHRSGRIDASLWQTIGKDTKLAEWKGYLVVLTQRGKMYLADSRRVALMQSTGEYQYEWFYLDGIGSYDGDSAVYTYVDTAEPYILLDTQDITDDDKKNAKILFEDEENKKIAIAIVGAKFKNTKDEEVEFALGEGDITQNDIVNSVEYHGVQIEYIEKDVTREGIKRKEAWIVEKTAECTGGSFSLACAVMEHNGDLYFGCENGDVCVFNTDKRGLDNEWDKTEIHPKWYNRCGHRYISGFSTLADNCGYPHFNKSTCGKSLTIRAKSMRNGTFSLRARTNREDWKDIERYVASGFDFSYLNFDNVDFETKKQRIFSSREKMKKWAEKQLYFFSDGFCEPFGIYNIAYVYEIVGKVK